MYKHFGKFDINDNDIIDELQKDILIDNSYLANGNLVNWFNHSAEVYSERIAITEIEDQSCRQLTYEQVHKFSNSIANYLLRIGTESGQNVAIYMTSKINICLAIWGIMKAGGTYTILNPYSKESISSILSFLHPALILTDKENLSTSCKRIQIDECLYEKDETTLIKYDIDDLLYIGLTSGMSGARKGVLVSQRGVLNTVFWRIWKYKFAPDNITFPLLNESFDAFGADFFSSMLSGGLLICADEKTKVNYSSVVDLIKNYRITNLTTTPTNFYYLLKLMSTDYSCNLRFVILGGEEINPSLPQIANRVLPGVVVFNEYGLTECSIISSYSIVNDENNINNIGRELPNTRFFLLDDGRLSDQGEIVVAGIGVARGYLDDPVKTNQTFFVNPYRNKSYLYRTGDSARKDDQGNFIFLGRLDRKIKMHGISIDLNDIEAGLLKEQTIEFAKVDLIVYREIEHAKISVTIVPAPLFKNKSVTFYRELIDEKFIKHTIPIEIQLAEQLTTNENGKIGHQIFDSENGKSVSQRVHECWCSILKVEQIDGDLSFFDIGGNSLLIMDMFFYLDKEFPNCLEIPDIFDNYTINMLSNYIESHYAG